MFENVFFYKTCSVLRANSSALILSWVLISGHRLEDYMRGLKVALKSVVHAESSTWQSSWCCCDVRLLLIKHYHWRFICRSLINTSDSFGAWSIVLHRREFYLTWDAVPHCAACDTMRDMEEVCVSEQLGDKAKVIVVSSVCSRAKC